MPQATREIKRRIRSIKNTRQITRAMELVSAAKMRKAVQNALATRTYANLAWQMLTELSSRTDQSHHPLLQKRETLKKVAVVVITSNRGLCGGFNHQLVQKMQKFIIEQQLKSVGLEADVVTVGKRGRDILLRQGSSIVAEFPKADITTKTEDITPLAKLLMDDYLSGKYDKVLVAYTDFISAISQKPRLKQILPIEQESGRQGVRKAESEFVATGHSLSDFNYEYTFEPSPDEVLEELLPRLLEIQIYQSLLESDASEHSARMLAMRNASEAAKDMIDSLTQAFNQARQASITTELADITGGRVAVEG